MTDSLIPRRTRTVTFVLPVYDEAESLPAFHEALLDATAARTDLAFRFLYVDDGSRDDSLDLLRKLRDDDDRVEVLALSRNNGHQVAVTAGLDAAAAPGSSADAVVVMDTDLQDPPAVAMRLVDAWEDGNDVVYAQRRSRHDGLAKRATAYGYYWLLGRLTDGRIPRNTGDFRLMDRRVVDEVVRYREHGRYLRGIVAQVGYRQQPVAFDRDARYAGTSGYSVRTMVRLAADGLVGFSRLPLRLVSAAGTLVGVAGLAVSSYAVLGWLDPGRTVGGSTVVTAAVLDVGALQLLAAGVLGSYLARVYDETRARPLYSLAVEETGPRDGRA